VDLDLTDWRKRQGKAFENEIRKSLQFLAERWRHFWFWKVMDFKIYYQINPRLQAPKVPADYFVCFRGKFYAIECKSSHSERRYGLQYIREHQKQTLTEIEKAGGEAWILLSWRRWMHKPRRPNRCFGFRISDWLRLEQEVLSEGFKSVSWSRIMQRGLEFKRSDGVWRLERMFLK